MHENVAHYLNEAICANKPTLPRHGLHNINPGIAQSASIDTSYHHVCEVLFWTYLRRELRVLPLVDPECARMRPFSGAEIW